MIDPNSYDLSAFDKLRWPVHLIDAEDHLTKKIPEICKYPEFKTAPSGIDKNKLLRYIVFCYDKNSPLFNELDKILERKVSAALLAGFEQDEELNFDDRVKKLFANELQEANLMIIRYARLQSSLDFSLLISGLDHFYSMLYTLENTTVKGGDILEVGKKKNALFKECRNQLIELREAAELVFGESKLLDDLDSITQTADPTLIKGSFVEHYAKAKKHERSSDYTNTAIQ